jgi:hypothetical protein
VIFLSCKANARVYDAKSGHGPHTPLPGAATYNNNNNNLLTASGLSPGGSGDFTFKLRQTY